MTEFIGALFDISIHALLAESDLPVFLSGFWAYLFLSTLSLRRATRGACRARPQSRPHFYPRSPCGERPCRKRRQWFHHGNFYPRSPCGERHQGQKVQDQEGHISIHALLAESDICIASGISVYIEFLSTLSLRRATKMKLLSQMTTDISIHALLAESDHFATLKFVNPYISIHALLAESDNIPLPNAHVISISIHALLAESDGIQPQRAVLMPPFLSTLSLRRATDIGSFLP